MNKYQITYTNEFKKVSTYHVWSKSVFMALRKFQLIHPACYSEDIKLVVRG